MFKILLICLVLITTAKSSQLRYLPGIQSSKDSQQICGFCVIAFERLQSVLQQNTTEAGIKNVLNDACNALPDREESQNCLTLVDKNLNHFYNFIRSNLDPGIICRVLKACDDSVVFKSNINQIQFSLKENNILERISKLNLKENTFKCDVCHVGVEIIDFELKRNTTEEAITNVVKNVCLLFPENSQYRIECLVVITEFGPVIIDLIGTDLLQPNLVCDALKLCASSNTKIEKSSFECTLCDMTVDVVDTLLKQNTTQDNIVNFCSIILCSALFQNPDFKDQCGSFVLEYAKPILEMLASNLDPKMVCSSLKICTSSSVNKLNVLKDKVVDIFRKTIQPKNVVETVECELCIYLVQYADNLLKNNATEQQILDEVLHICNLFSSDIKPQCQSFLIEYGPYVLDLIANDISPTDSCQHIGFCPKNSKLIDLNNEKLN